ncbi:hypothetical protein FHG87_004045 [Trinorchestia longiramus]|nr:hypothetical protein FHG87_004045 [Trinorchestia longiramus]
MAERERWMSLLLGGSMDHEIKISVSNYNQQSSILVHHLGRHLQKIVKLGAGPVFLKVVRTAPVGGVEEIQGGSRRVRLEWGAYITV